MAKWDQVWDGAGRSEPALRDDQDVAWPYVGVSGDVAALQQVPQPHVVELAAVGDAEDPRAVAVGVVGQPADRDHHVEYRHVLAIGEGLRLRRLADHANLLVGGSGEAGDDNGYDRIADVFDERLL